MNTITFIAEQPKKIISNQFKNAMTTALYFGLLYGSAFAFIALTSFTWINFKSIY
ncbi:hypothetical protein HC725_04490 [Vibrio sp. S17_S38]|uniref:hypothetical protein n=1 Tax=Vibrio sp. S17_S38 TaxID=2720229 RepID=UPI00167FF4BB|nr:hypothetical protein [Vibrio sp. S17_S38]MBD1572535.1 hypothetical protein [Vibrio sp. S17_S38]